MDPNGIEISFDLSKEYFRALQLLAEEKSGTIECILIPAVREWIENEVKKRGYDCLDAYIQKFDKDLTMDEICEDLASVRQISFYVDKEMIPVYVEKMQKGQSDGESAREGFCKFAIDIEPRLFSLYIKRLQETRSENYRWGGWQSESENGQD